MTYRSASPAITAALRAALLGAASGTAFVAPAYATGTVAGTNIDNVATATYDLPNGGSGSVTSNTVSLKVDELLDVSVAATDPGDISVVPGALAQVLTFKVTNAGNGQEAFTLSTQQGSGDDFDPVVTAIVRDTNGNGVYDAGVDTVYIPSVNDPDLAPDASSVVFVLSTIPATATDGQRGRIDLKAVSKTGSGTPGTTFAGKGQGGGNAVVGATTAAASNTGYYKLSAASVAFVKSATVADPFGGATQVPGATITYSLVATVSGSGVLANLRIADGIPAGSTYKPGSITLDGTALSDADDSDAGNFTGTGIAVKLGTVAAGATRTVKFQVKID